MKWYRDYSMQSRTIANFTLESMSYENRGKNIDSCCHHGDGSFMMTTETTFSKREMFHLITPRSSTILEDSSSVSSDDEDEQGACVEYVTDGTTNDALAKSHSQPKPRNLGHMLQRLFLFVASLWLVNYHHRILPLAEQQPAPKDSVCVAGGGFSGFWFTLGRLRSIPDLYSKEYYCFSAGCLATVATFRGYSMEHLYDTASSIQRQWRTGEISRYAVVSAFVDQLLLHDQTDPTAADDSKSNKNKTTLTPLINRSDLLSRLHIETTVKAGWWGVTTSIRTPHNIEELRAMLIQTAFIPFATGNDLWLQDHMDGAFSLPHHPACEHYVGLSVGWDLMDLLWNVINVNLSRDRVERFWNMGLEYGL